MALIAGKKCLTQFKPMQNFARPGKILALITADMRSGRFRDSTPNLSSRAICY
jgi:hypothetical protein